MKKQFRKMTTLLFGEEVLSNSIYSDTNKINTLTQEFNSSLEISKNSKEALLSTHISETVIGPLPFYGVKNKEKFDFVYMQLTASYDSKRIHIEKQSAGDDWNSYYDFYTSNKIIEFLKEEKSRFTRSLSKVLFSLYNEHEIGKIDLDHIASKFSIEQNEILTRLVKDKSILLANLVPFHSNLFDTNMNGINHLRETIPSFDKYLNNLLEYINKNTEDNAIIMTNGFVNSRVVQALLELEGAGKLLENKLFTLLKWNTKYAVLFNDQFISRHGLRTDLEIDKVLSLVSSISKGDLKAEAYINELKDYSDDLLEKRSEEDFKDRGRRIKGSKAKGFNITKIKNDN